MSSQARGPGPEVGPVGGGLYDHHLLLRNDGADPTVLTIVRRADDYVASDTVRAEPQTTYGVTLPVGAGSTLVEVHGEETMATLSVDPDERPPLFSYRDGAVLVDRE